MQLYLLEYFRRVAQLENYTKAAKELHIAQPALSKLINQLENTLGTRLFNRTGRGVMLTEAGKILLNHCNLIISEWGKAQNNINALKCLDHGYLRLAAFPTFVWYILPLFLPDFIKNYPMIDLEIENAQNDTIIEWVLDHRVEAGVAVLPVSHPRIMELPLYTEEFGILVPKGHPWCGRDQLKIEELDQCPVIIPTLNQWYRNFLLPSLQEYNIKLQTKLVLHSNHAIVKLVEAGVGPALLPLLAKADTECDSTTSMLRITPPLKRSFAWVERRDRYRSPSSEMFLSHLISYIKESDLPTPLCSMPETSDFL